MRRKISMEFKREAVELVLRSPERKQAELASQLGVDPSQLGRWVTAFGPPVSPGRRPVDVMLEVLRSENDELKFRNRELLSRIDELERERNQLSRHLRQVERAVKLLSRPDAASVASEAEAETIRVRALLPISAISKCPRGRLSAEAVEACYWLMDIGKSNTEIAGILNLTPAALVYRRKLYTELGGRERPRSAGALDLDPIRHRVSAPHAPQAA